MAKQWSDYMNTVYRYLKNYRMFNVQVANLDLEIQGIHDEIKSLADAKTAKYGTDTGGGFSELNAMERIVTRKKYLEGKLPVLLADRHRVMSLIQRIDNAMLSLGETERTIVRMKFIEKRKWLDISMETQYSERSCQGIARRSVAEITEIMFPDSVEGQQRFSFVFLDSRNPTEENADS